MERLVFNWSPGSTACDCMALDQNGNRQGPIRRGVDIAGLSASVEGRQLLWLAPGSEMLALSADLPVKGRDKIVRALPYALEEQFAEDPDRLFFALPGQTGSDATQALAVDAGWLQRALAELADQRLVPGRVVPDYLTLPWEPGTWTVLTDAGMLYARTGPILGFALEADTGRQVLTRQLDRLAEDARPVRIRGIRGREPWGDMPELPGLEWDSEPVSEGLLGVAQRTLTGEPPINLLQGPFNPRRRWGAALRPWLPAAGALAAVVLLALASFVAGWVQNSREASSLHEAVTERFHEIVPNQPIEDIRSQVNQRLQQAAGGANRTGLLPMLGALAQADTSGATIESLTYQIGTLDVRVHAADVGTLEGLRTRIASRSGLPVAIRSANQTKSGVEGDLSIGSGSSQ